MSEFLFRYICIMLLVFMVAHDTYGAAENVSNVPVGVIQGGTELYVNVGGSIKVRNVNYFQSTMSIIDISTAGNTAYNLARHAGTIASIVCVNEASITEDTALSAAINGVLVTGGTVTISSTATSAPYAEHTGTPTALNIVALHDVLSMSTAGGSLITTNAHCTMFLTP